jgi:ribonuclease Z
MLRLFDLWFQVDMYDRPRIPAGYHQQLPKFSRPWFDAPPPTLAYVVVGPSVRGKFDVEKSVELGVPKNMRSRLTRGENVTVTVNEGDMTVERVVRPLDCIGPSEIPAVSAHLVLPSVSQSSSRF